MVKKVIIFFAINLFLLINTSIILAAAGEAGDDCINSGDCKTGYICKGLVANPARLVCQEAPPTDLFGKIEAPESIKQFAGGDETGASGLSKFLTNLVALIYSSAAVVLIFMLIWGAWDWITSEGQKDKIEGARRKIINAIIGIMLFAAAFAVISVIGSFTGFKFFTTKPNTLTNPAIICGPGFQRDPNSGECVKNP